MSMHVSPRLLIKTKYIARGSVYIVAHIRQYISVAQPTSANISVAHPTSANISVATVKNLTSIISWGSNCCVFRGSVYPRKCEITHVRSD